MKLLIIEDERELSKSIVTFLSSEKYICEQAFTFNEAIEKLELYEYDCILLDLMLPGVFFTGNKNTIIRPTYTMPAHLHIASPTTCRHLIGIHDRKIPA